MATTFDSYTNPRLELGVAFEEYRQAEDAFIGPRLMPYLDVPKKAAKFPVRDKASQLTPEDVSHAPGAVYARGDEKFTELEYSCVERGFESKLPISTTAFYRSEFDAEMYGARNAMWKVLYDHELTVKNRLIDTTNFTTGNGRRTDVSTAWSTVSADIQGDVLAAKEAVRSRTGMEPNCMWIGKVDLRHLLRNTDVKESIKYTRTMSLMIIREALADYFGVDELLVGKGISNSADEEQTFSKADIWGTGWAGLLVVPKSEDIIEPGFGRSFIWSDETPEGALVESYWENQTRSMIYRARMFSDEKVFDYDFAQLLDTAA